METRVGLPEAEIETRLGIDAQGRRKRRLRQWLLGEGLLVAAAGIGGIAISQLRSQEPSVQYRTEEVRRGALTITVEATGKLEPLTQVNVGTEISGIIQTVAVDFNDTVRTGQVLAEVNTDKLRAQAEQARAALQAAEARLLQAQATVREARNQLARLEEVRQLSAGRVPSRHELDAQEAAVKRAEAEEASAEAQITQAKATLAAIETDLRKATIRSPINGIVLDRKVDPGQTVAASFQTPTLFTIAQDLSRMQLNVDVDEADVGSVRAGQEAAFRVDAHPDRTFASRVVDVRNTPQTVGGVVTYQTLLSADNSELLLKPGMTATAVITVKQLNNVVLVPNAALRFRPPAQTEETTTSSGRGLLESLLPRPPRPASGVSSRPAAAGTKEHSQVWVLEGGEPIPISVGGGATDGTMTEITSGDLAPGTPVLVDIVTKGL